MVWGALIGAGASLLGGVLGSKEKKKDRAHANALQQQAWARDDNRIQRTVADAEKAGINPLTAVRGGASAGNTITHAPGLGGYGIAEAIGAAGDSLARGVQMAFDYDPLDERRAQLELDIQEATLRNLNQQMAGLGAVPTASGSRYQYGGGGLGGPSAPEEGRTTVTNPWPTNSGMVVNPNYVDAEQWEQRYGDIAQEIAGFGNFLADSGYNSDMGSTRVAHTGASGGTVSSGNAVRGPSLGYLAADFAGWMTRGLRRANERARFNNRFNQAFGW
jgi:hypothetical protein